MKPVFRKYMDKSMLVLSKIAYKVISCKNYYLLKRFTSQHLYLLGVHWVQFFHLKIKLRNENKRKYFLYYRSIYVACMTAAMSTMYSTSPN